MGKERHPLRPLATASSGYPTPAVRLPPHLPE
uniref:Uncharacterized protein n=1 Tax=Arundo donax TaxID=35708 RepID=A0A0A9BA79_ARUDO